MTTDRLQAGKNGASVLLCVQHTLIANPGRGRHHWLARDEDNYRALPSEVPTYYTGLAALSRTLVAAILR